MLIIGLDVLYSFLIIMLITLIMVPFLRNIDTSTRMSDFVPESDFRDTDIMIKNEYNTSKPIINIVESDSGTILDRNGLLALQAIEKEILSSDSLEPYLVVDEPPITSPATIIESILIDQSNGKMGIHNATDEILSVAISQAKTDEEFSILIGEDGGAALLIVKLKYSMIPNDDEQVEIDLTEICNNGTPDGYETISFSAVGYHMQNGTKESLSIRLPIVIILVIIVLSITLKNPIKVALSGFGLIITLLISFGIFSLVRLQFSQMMFFAPIVIMVLGIDYTIHIFHRYDEFRESSHTRDKSMSKGIRFMGISILLSVITTILAFSSNGLSDIPAVSSFGIFLGIGITISFFIMTIFVPSLYILIKRRKLGNIRQKKDGKRSSGRSHISRAVSVFVKHADTKPFAVILIAFLIFCAGLGLAVNIERDMTPKDAMSSDSPITRSVDILNDQFPGMGMDQAFVVIEGDVADPGFLESLHLSIENMRNDDKVVIKQTGPAVQSVLPLMQGYTEYVLTKQYTNETGIDPIIQDLNSDLLPDTKEGRIYILDQLFEKGFGDRASPGAVRSLLKRNEGDYTGIILIIQAHQVEGGKGGHLHDELKEDFEPISSNSIHYTGSMFERYEMVTGMTEGMIISTVTTTVLALVILTILFRSFRFGTLTILPIIFVVGWLLLSMYLLDVKLNMVTVTITSFTVGIGADYAIHLVERYRQQFRKSKDRVKSMETAILTSGKSLTAAGLTTLSGFIVLATSDIGTLGSFGLLGSLMIVYSLISSIIVLPTLVLASEKVMEKWKGRRNCNNSN
jgi:predicted RND superfamily exporter protein